MPRTVSPEKALAALVARRVRELRAEREWNQDRLAAETGGKVARSFIATIETGARLPSLATIALLAHAFRVPVAALVVDPQTISGRIVLAVLVADLPMLDRVARVLGIGVERSP